MNNKHRHLSAVLSKARIAAELRSDEIALFAGIKISKDVLNRASKGTQPLPSKYIMPISRVLNIEPEIIIQAMTMDYGEALQDELTKYKTKLT